MTEDTLSACLAADVPVLLWGPPGTGKTAALVALASAAGAHVEVLIGSTLDPVDVGGLPVPDASGVVQISPPPWARRLRAAIDAGQPAWLLLDELSCSPPSVQAALLRVVQERQAAGVDLRGCRVVGAANPAESAADGGWLSPAAANRWAHVDWTPTVSAWVRGQLGGWGRPQSAAEAAVAASVCSYLTRSPAALCAPATGEQAGRAWPSPRSWSAVVRAVAALPGGVDSSSSLGVAASLVGPGAASEWRTAHEAADLADPEEILAGRATLPTRGDLALAGAMSVVAAAISPHPEREGRIERAAAIVVTLRPDQSVVPAAALIDAADVVPAVLARLGREIRDAVSGVGATLRR